MNLDLHLTGEQCLLNENILNVFIPEAGRF